jgi:hypothetical protein
MHGMYVSDKKKMKDRMFIEGHGEDSFLRIYTSFVTNITPIIDTQEYNR